MLIQSLPLFAGILLLGGSRNGDFDGDGDVDLTDYGAFQSCFSGQGYPAPSECNVFNYDDDGDVDLVDFGQFQTLFGTQPAARVTYDYRNQMISYEEFEDGSATTINSYFYDALGRRVAKIVDHGGPDEFETRYHYSGWRVIQELNWVFNDLATYVYGNYIDEVVQMRRDVDGTGGPEDYYYLHDDMFNVVTLVDDTGTVVERYEYGDYGSPTYMDGSWTTLSGAASDYDNPYLFTGRRYDNETAWYNYRTRYYDPFTGRFTARDPFGFWIDDLGSGYSYVGNNPFSSLDPFGLFECERVVENAPTQAGKDAAFSWLTNEWELARAAPEGASEGSTKMHPNVSAGFTDTFKAAFVRQYAEVFKCCSGPNNTPQYVYGSPLYASTLVEIDQLGPTDLIPVMAGSYSFSWPNTKGLVSVSFNVSTVTAMGAENQLESLANQYKPYGDKGIDIVWANREMIEKSLPKGGVLKKCISCDNTGNAAPWPTTNGKPTVPTNPKPGALPPIIPDIA